MPDFIVIPLALLLFVTGLFLSVFLLFDWIGQLFGGEFDTKDLKVWGVITIITGILLNWITYSSKNLNKTTTTAKVYVDGRIAKVKVGDKTINLNQKYEKNFIDGETLTFKYNEPQWSYGIYWNQLEVLEKEN